MTLLAPVPEKRFRLRDGSKGTEYEALAEALKTLEAKKQLIEDEIEEIRYRMNTAEGAPLP